MLLYFVLLALLATLSPFDFRGRPVHGFALLFLRDDFALNLLLFFPIGFLSQLAWRIPSLSLVRLTGLALALSTAVEAGQCFLPSRHPNGVDVLANTLGALLGALIARRISRELARLLSEELVLELPITGSLYLLFALGAVLGFSVVHALDLARVLPLAPFGAIPLAALHRERFAQRVLVAAPRLALYGGCGALGALLIAVLRVPGPTLLVALAFAVLTWLLTRRGQHAHGRQRRFEAVTGLRTLPWLALYFLMLGLHRPAADALANQASLLLLESCLAHTLLGYVWSEIGSRSMRPTWQLVAGIGLSGAPVALALELCHGAGPLAARTVRWALLTLATAAGALLHRAQVALVRSYRAR
jgi:glycopeptide antibiotics resistance protein